MHEEELELLAQKAREIFCREMRNYCLRVRGQDTNWGRGRIPRWDGGERESDGAVFQSVWPKIVQFSLKNSIPLEDLIESIFWSRNGGDPPLPTNCYDKNAVEIYNKYKSVNGNDVSMAFTYESQKNLFFRELSLRLEYSKLLGWKIEYITYDVLHDASLPLSSVFRYCMAVKAGLYELSDELLSDAIKQYSTETHLYDLYWKDFITEDLKEAATRLKSI